MSHRRLPLAEHSPFPAYVVWELTLRCDHACTHCGSRAGPAQARPRELSTAEALEVAGQLADLGAREVVLIGGEAYLHPGFLDVIRSLAEREVSVQLTSGGRGVTADVARAAADAGLRAASISVDGLEATHDRMRASPGSFAGTRAALAHLREAGVAIAANTNLNRLNQGDLEPLYAHLRDQGIGAWQVQLTAPLGRAADRAHLILQPWDLLDLVPRIAALKRQAQADGVRLQPGNNLGYYGPEEGLLRSLEPGVPDRWQGCQAGRFVLGIESDGAVKGCPSLQTAHYVGGNLRERSLRSIWDHSPELAFTRARTVDSLWGFCRSCPYAEACLGGCTFTAHSLLGRPGNNPYCHYRALTLAKSGQRERLVPAERASGAPFDNGRFEVLVEALDAPDPGADQDAGKRVAIARAATSATG